tara:strand:+ start:2750 stop:3568 length:819 start_codon:yes stop_codon:yes gene_type:complete
MIYIKTYCYSKHELPFIIAQLEESKDYVDKLCIYEYNYTHTGQKKEYEIEKVLDQIPKHLIEKLYYKKVDLTDYNVNSYEDESLCHRINEPIQRNWFYNDENIILNDYDIILDIDCDEIIYSNKYPLLIKELMFKKHPLSIKLNQFFFKSNYLWKDCNFSSPSIYFYGHVKNIPSKIKNLNIKNLRDLPLKTDSIYGCHMSWVMPIENMVEKCYKTAHTRYRHLADPNILKNAIEEKKYIFDLNRPFNIEELKYEDHRIPKYLQKENIFDYL